MPVITQLWVYPIKSCRGVAVDTATLLASGLKHDREMMIVDADNGRFITQRTDAVLASIAVDFIDDTVVLQQPQHGDCRFQRQFTQPVIAKVWSREVPAFDQGDTVADFLSAVVGRRVRLLATRPIDTSTAERPILFQDGRAVHILSEATLNHVRQALPDIDIDARRFRPNIVIGDHKADTQKLAAFAEDHWQHVHTASTSITVENLCQRCIMPSINPDNLHNDAAVQNYLLKHRLIKGEPCLGINGCGVRLGHLQVGEKVKVIS